MELRICVDVSDLEAGIAFYRDALGLRPGRRLGASWVEMVGGAVPVDLLSAEPGSQSSPRGADRRSFSRHWTPVHLDCVVANLDAALERALKAGATQDRDVQTRKWGRLANLADPFGNGFCLLEMRGRGYDELLSPGLGV